MTKKYNAVLLDLDGTISNTYRGIVKCLAPACERHGVDLFAYDVRQFIGPPLSQTFAILIPNDEQAQKDALKYYRELYLQHGIYDNDLYEGIDEFADGLRKKGVLVGVATCKHEPFAKEALNQLHMLPFLDFVCGSQPGRVSKTEIINAAIDLYGIDRQKCLMIGDTFYDMQGAEQCGVDAVGVLYGFGKKNEMEKYPHIGIVETVEKLKEFVYPLTEKK